MEIRAGLDGGVENANVQRYAPFSSRHLRPPRRRTGPDGVVLATGTRISGVRIVAAQRVRTEGVVVLSREITKDDTTIAEHLVCRAEQGRRLSVEKTVALATSLDTAICDPATAACSALGRAPAFEVLEAGHRAAWGRLWARTGLEVEREDMRRSLRFHAFHILQTVSPHSADLDVGIPSRGWHGEGYHGHIFWDDIFIFPFLSFRFPALARELLLYRYRRLGSAQVAAQRAGYRGAMFPWRSASDGREVTPQYQFNLISGRWMPDHTYLQRHIGSAIAWNIWQFYLATGDREFLAEHGAEMLVEIARFWASRVEHDPLEDRFDIRGVIGPDEYHNAYPGSASPGLDNNAYTNLMAVWTLCRAAEVLDHLPAGRRQEIWSKLGLTEDEFTLWDWISRRMRIVFHNDGVISQFEGFDRLEPFDPDRLPEDLSDTRVDWALEAISESADRYQVTKQADALTLFYMLPLKEACALLARLGYDFDEERFRRTAAYYLARTTHRSSLSRIVYAGALAEIDLPRSWNLYQEALGTDLHALKGESTAEGVHLGAMGGTLDVLQRRYLGLGFDADGLRLDPSLPDDLGRVRIAFQFRGLALAIEAEDTSLTMTSAPENRDHVLVRHRGEEFHLGPGQHLTVRSRDE